MTISISIKLEDFMKIIIMTTLSLMLGFFSSCSIVNSSRYLASNKDEIVEHNGIKYLMTKDCYDQDRLYKSCQNQEVLLDRTVKKALKSKKNVLVIYGYERCVWCNRLINLLRDSSISEYVEDKFILRTIDSRSVDQSGKIVRDQLASDASVEAIKSTPHLFIIDPINKTVKSIKTGNLERNAWDSDAKQDIILNPWYGFEANRVLEALKQ